MIIRILNVLRFLFLILSFLCFGLYMGGRFERNDYAAAQDRLSESLITKEKMKRKILI